MTSRKRRPSAAEIDLWRRVTADVEPIKRPSSPAATVAPTATRPSGASATTSSGTTRRRVATVIAQPRVELTPLAPALDPRRPVDIDRRTWQRLKRGQIRVERRIDLHGHSQAEAHDRLARFLDSATRDGLRCVLVVTGKGIAGGGVLRRMVPRWLAEEGRRDKIVSFCQAQPRHGGDGALYVLLKRRRAPSRGA